MLNIYVRQCVIFITKNCTIIIVYGMCMSTFFLLEKHLRQSTIIVAINIASMFLI